MKLTIADTQICRSSIAWYLHDAQDQTVATFLRGISDKIAALQDLTHREALVLCKVLQEYAQFLRGSRQAVPLADAKTADHAVQTLQAYILSAQFQPPVV